MRVGPCFFYVLATEYRLRIPDLHGLSGRELHEVLDAFQGISQMWIATLIKFGFQVCQASCLELE